MNMYHLWSLMQVVDKSFFFLYSEKSIHQGDQQEELKYNKYSNKWYGCLFSKFFEIHSYPPTFDILSSTNFCSAMLMFENCAGDIGLASMQENNGKTEQERLSRFFELLPLPIRTHLESFHQLGPNESSPNLEPISSPKWNCSKLSRGNARSICTMNVIVSIGTGLVEKLP